MQPKSQSALRARPGVRALKGAGIGDLHPHMKAVRCPNAGAQLPWSNVVSALWMARVERSLSIWTPHLTPCILGPSHVLGGPFRTPYTVYQRGHGTGMPSRPAFEETRPSF
jgi:hypothetical protein